jgi:hypothetical protein
MARPQLTILIALVLAAFAPAERTPGSALSRANSQDDFSATSMPIGWCWRFCLALILWALTWPETFGR